MPSAFPIFIPISKRKTAIVAPANYPQNIIFIDRITAAVPSPKQRQRNANAARKPKPRIQKKGSLEMSQKNKGVCCILLSSFSFALMNLFVHLSGDLPSVQKSFFRNFVAMLFALFILLKERPTIRLDGASKKYLFLRSFCGTVGILCNFYAVDHLVLADASMLNKMSPFFAILFGILILKERINLFQGLCVVAAFIGTLFVIKPTPSNLACFPALIGLLGGLGAGIAYTCVRALGMKGVKGSFIVFFFSAFSCVVTLPYLIFRYHPMTPKQLGILLLAGLAAAGGQFSITAAYKFAPAKEISVYDYSQIIFSALLGFILFSQLPDIWSFIGYVIICGVGVAMFFYNNRKDK